MKNWKERRSNIVPRGVGAFVDSSAVSASGVYITEANGRKLLDFGGGIGVLNAGHCPESVVEAMHAQAKKLIHTCFHVSTYEPYLELAEMLAELFPHDKQTKVMLTNTGAEAVENAIKIARQATKRPAVLAFTHAFHGRSMMAMTLTSKVDYKTDCGPFAPEVYRTEFPNLYRNSDGLNENEFCDRELRRLHEFVKTHVPANKLAAIIIELVQGEGGFNVAPVPYIQGLRKFCDEHQIMLIFDEVQSGFCRTGKWAAYQHYNVTPDISTWAKSMGSGMPIGAVIGKAKVMDAPLPGTIGGTFLGNPVSCAAAIATIKLMKTLKLNERSESIGKTIMTRFRSMAEWCPNIGDIRGLGAMVAMEFVTDRNTKAPDAKTTELVANLCLEKGLLILRAGIEKNVIRVLCPLVISDTELNRGIDIIEACLKESTKGGAK